MTRGDITSQVQSWLGLQQIAGLDETPLVHSAIYGGIIDVLSRTRCVVRCIDLHYQAGIDTYVLDQGVLAMVDVGNGSNRRLRRDQSGVSDNFYGDVVYPAGSGSVNPGFTLIRSDVLQIKPLPAADGELQVWAVLRPAEMTDDSNDIGDEEYGAIPYEFQDAVVLYTLWQMADYADNAATKKGEQYRVQYEGQDGNSGRIRQIKAMVNRRGTSRAPALRITLAPAADRWATTG